MLAMLAGGAPLAAQRASSPPQNTRPGNVGCGVSTAVPTLAFEWWKDPEVKRDLRLTEEKARKIDEMFSRLERARRPLCDKLAEERARLNKMTNERVADEAAYALQVAQVESLWARWRESRTVTIYRMFLELQPDQFKKLQEIFDRRAAADGRGRGPER